MVVLKQMLVFLIMIIFGIVARKYHILTKENQSQFSSMVINIASPCLILSSAISAEDRIAAEEVVEMLGILLVLTVLVLTLSALVPRLLRYPKKDRSIANLMFWCTNVTFIGLPLVKSIYGNEAVIYVTFAVMLINILFYSYGVILVSSNAGQKRKFNPKSLLNPGMAACMGTCLIYFLQIPVPDVLATSLTMVGNLTAPLAMMMIGFGLMDISLKETVTDVNLILLVLCKMLVMPALVLLVIKHLIDNAYLLAACLAAVATPTGGMVAMLATLYNKDAYLTVTKEISISTLLSVITIPVVAFIVGI